MQKKKILFVCLGNICRSPMMEYVFRAEAESRGVAYPPARRELAAHGICCDGKRARKLTEDDYRRFDLIVTAEERNSRAASRIFGGDPNGKICRLLDFCARPRDIDDPWWTGDFKTAYNDILEGVTALLDKLTAK